MAFVLAHRSVSQVTSWQRCPEGYRLEKIARAPRAPAAWFIQGTAYHEAVEKWERSNRAYGPDQLAAWYDEAWNREYEREIAREPDISRWLTGGHVKPEKDIPRRQERGREQAESYFEYAIEAPEKIWEPAPDFPALELGFDVDLDGIKVKGFIDQVYELPDGRIRPRDLKTGTKLPDNPFQLGVYKIALEDLFGITITDGDFFMAKNNAPTAAYDLRMYTREKVTRWFHQMDRAVRLKVFPPNPGDACRTCGVWRYCDFNGPQADEYREGIA